VQIKQFIPLHKANMYNHDIRNLLARLRCVETQTSVSRAKGSRESKMRDFVGNSVREFGLADYRAAMSFELHFIL